MITKNTEVHQQVWGSPAPAVADTTSVHAAITTAAVITTGITNPDVPRTMRIVSGGSGHSAAGNVVFTGTDILGATITDTLTLNGNTAVEGVKAFATVTSIDTTGVTGNDANDTIACGFGQSLGLDSLCNAHSFDNVPTALITSKTVSTTVISSNIIKLAATLDGSTVQAVTYIPDTFPSGRIWG